MAVTPAGGLAVTYPGTLAVGGLLYTVGVDGTIGMFDNGVLRPKIDSNSESLDAGDPSTFELAFNDTGSMLYAYNSFLSSFELKRESVSPKGVQWLSTTPGLISGYGTKIRYAQGLLYTSYGAVIDPERFVMAGRFVDSSLIPAARVAPDPANGRVFFLTGFEILVFDINTHALLGKLAIGALSNEYPLNLVRFGSDGLAFNTSSGRLYLVSISAIPLFQTPIPSPQLASIAVNGIAPLFSPVPVIPPGSWVSIFDANLSSTTATWNDDFPISLAGVSVTINNKPAYVEFVSPGMINVQAPDDTATGPFRFP